MFLLTKYFLINFFQAPTRAPTKKPTLVSQKSDKIIMAVNISYILLIISSTQVPTRDPTSVPTEKPTLVRNNLVTLRIKSHVLVIVQLMFDS